MPSFKPSVTGFLDDPHIFHLSSSSTIEVEFVPSILSESVPTGVLGYALSDDCGSLDSDEEFVYNELPDTFESVSDPLPPRVRHQMSTPLSSSQTHYNCKNAMNSFHASRGSTSSIFHYAERSRTFPFCQK